MRRADLVKWSVQCGSGGLSYGRRFFLTPDGTPRSESAYGVRLLFPGREYLVPLGLYDHRHRAYSPTLGRFLQVDPVAFAGGDVNLYRFCANKPVNFVDPYGETPLVTAGVGGVIGGLVAVVQAIRSGACWDEVGYAALRGAATGAVAGLVMGCGGGLIAGWLGGGWLGGAAAGATAGIAGNLAGQGLGWATARRATVDLDEVAVSGVLGALWGGVFARPYTAASQQVTSWAQAGVSPDLAPGRWVVVGGPTFANYLRTVGPALRQYPYGNNVTAVVSSRNLSFPPSLSGNLAGILGQRIIRP